MSFKGKKYNKITTQIISVCVEIWIVCFPTVKLTARRKLIYRGKKDNKK